MSTELEGVRLGSDAVDGSNASRSEVGNDQMCETLVDSLSSQGEDVVAKKEGESGSLASEGDNGMEKRNGFADLEKGKESVSTKELDLGIGTKNVDVEMNESEKKVSVDSEDVVMVEGQTEALVPEIVRSDDANVSDVKGSDVGMNREDLGEGRHSDGLGKHGSKVEEMDIDMFMGLEPHESKDESVLDDDKGSVTSKVKFSDSDLVWAKVRSHPWWPGQVHNASSATDKAKKYSKKGSHLVTYFGDCSFAWNDASKVKPFREHFSQMAKQSRLPDFVDAIDFALDEVSRRIEFGLACSCISEEVYQKIKTQNIINPGIREESSSIHGGDKVSSAVFFEPANLVEYVKRLARSPNYDATDELQFVSQRARLLAFNRWKGYTDLPEFETIQGSVESATKISPAEEKSSLSEVKTPEPKKSEQVYTKKRKTEVKATVPESKMSEQFYTKKRKTEVKATVPEPKKTEQVYTKKRKTEEKATVPEPKKTEEVYTNKRKTEDQEDSKHDGVFDYEDTTVPKRKKKKEKTLAEYIAEIRLSRSNGIVSHETSGIKQDSKKKQKFAHSKLPKSTKKIKANLQTEDKGSPFSPKDDKKCNVSAGDKITPKKARTSFGIGQSILRVASQMHSSTPTKLIHCSKSNSKMAAKNNGSGKKSQEKSKTEALSEIEVSPSPHSGSITKTRSAKPNSINVHHLQSGELEQVIKETPGTNLVEDSMVESSGLKESTKEKMVLEDKKEEAANTAGETTIKDSNLTGEKSSGPDLKESTKEQMVLEDQKDEAEYIAGETTIKDSNLTEEKITASDLKERDCSGSCSKEDSSAE